MSVDYQNSKSKDFLASPRFLSWLATWTVILFVSAILALIFVPWQQTIIGTGTVTVFSPMQRPQSIEAQISGRLKSWYVMEGQRVKAGQRVAELVDTDPKFLDIEQIKRLEEQRIALIERQKAIQSRIVALQHQMSGLTRSQSAAIPGAGERITQSNDRIMAAEQAVEAARQNLATTDFNYGRVKSLFEKGLRSKRDFELAELDKVRAETSMQQVDAQLKVTQRDFSVARFDREKITGDTSAAIANVAATIASAQETVATTASDIAKLAVEIQNLRMRMDQRQITAPVDGRIVRLMRVGTSETVSAGAIMAVVVPDTQDQAVELYVSDWDVPLLSEGRLVRLQFSGWPAIQFSGWPMIASGTFGGRVAVVDAVDDGKGRYRILVKPDTESIKAGQDEPWPTGNYLRPGTEATGWVLLDTVPLGYELWRQFNAFPPTLKEKPGEGDETDEGGKQKPIKRKVKK
ncbi:HlyD family secretion protein [Vampirovibrio sp.]|uniref:HlyD family secretion protein n=1 Tax=Vampirovibrio sp. TaxID=2717857 RepID=UPI003593D223